MSDDFVPENRRSNAVLVVLTAFAFLVSAMLFSLEEALVYSTVFGAFVSVVQTRPKQLRNKIFWLLVAVFALIHIVALSLIHIPVLRFGLAVLPFALVDGLIMWWLIKWIEQRFPASVKTGSS